MPATTVVRAEGPLLSHWLEVYTLASKRHLKSAMLSVADLQGLLDSKHVNPDSFLLEMTRAGPTAAARLVIDHSRGCAHISDLALSPERKNAGVELVDYILGTTRNQGLLRLESEVLDYMSSSADVLSKYTFEPRQTYSHLRDLMTSPPESGIEVSTTEVMRRLGPLSIEEHCPLADLFENAARKWRPVIGLRYELEPNVSVFGYQSEKIPTRGYLLIDSIGIIDPKNVILTLKGALHHMYRDGVRDVKTKAEGDSVLQWALTSIGFVIEFTSHKFVMDMYYSER
ncbi:MAG: hypothetical protein JSW61_09735 [Candidatus Thorarchaeota archaeon]|nr:MAG: hypothetical protein JSW61_09735 [Candidatus Thorarchaeota archaeon]